MQLNSGLLSTLRLLRRNTSGLAVLEFALSMPIFTGLGAYGLEVANTALIRMRVSQVALGVADNASRAGERSTLAVKTIDEADVKEVFLGAKHQAGNIDVLAKGRIVLSSLERNASGGHWIHWQRCKGLKNYPSQYGNEGTGATGTAFPGMGPATNRIQAPAGGAVMYVEVAYEFEPMISDYFVARHVIRYAASYLVRERRDLAGTGIRNVGNTTDLATCDRFSA
jgi:hypothetical protein